MTRLNPLHFQNRTGSVQFFGASFIQFFMQFFMQFFGASLRFRNDSLRWGRQEVRRNQTQVAA